MSILHVRSPSWVCIAGEWKWEQKEIQIFSCAGIPNKSILFLYNQKSLSHILSICLSLLSSLPLTLPSLPLSANCILRVTCMQVFGEQRGWGGCNGESFLMRGKERWEDGRDLQIKRKGEEYGEENGENEREKEKGGREEGNGGASRLWLLAMESLVRGFQFQLRKMKEQTRYF